MTMTVWCVQARYLARKDAEAARDRPPFKPTHPPKKSIHFDKAMTLSPYPEHLADPKVENKYFATQKLAEGQVNVERTVVFASSGQRIIDGLGFHALL